MERVKGGKKHVWHCKRQLSLLHTNINKEMKGEISGWTELSSVI